MASIEELSKRIENIESSLEKAQLELELCKKEDYIKKVTEFLDNAIRELPEYEESITEAKEKIIKLINTDDLGNFGTAKLFMQNLKDKYWAVEKAKRNLSEAEEQLKGILKIIKED